MWSKWSFPVNQVKYWSHDAPHTLAGRGAIVQLVNFEHITVQ